MLGVRFLPSSINIADGREVKKLRREIIALRWAVCLLAICCFVAGSFPRIPDPTGSTEAVVGLPTMNAESLDKKNFLPPLDAVAIDIPELFDTRQQWLGCGTFVVDQKQCGDCWAGSAANTLGDRACIHLLEGGKPMPLPRGGPHGAGTLQRMFQQAGKCVGEGTMNALHQHGCQRQSYFVNPQALVSCGNLNNTDPPRFHPYPEGSGYRPGHILYPSSMGCNGGEAQDAWRFFYHEGLTIMDATQLAGCTTYTSGTCSGADPNNNGCRPCEFEQCADTGLKPERITVDTFGWIMERDLPDRGTWDNQLESFTKKGTDQFRPPWQREAMDRQVKNMQIEMMTNGPLHTCMDDYANFGLFFNQNPSGIYNSTEGSPQTGGHCIELMGWGLDKATGMKYWTFKNSWGAAWANGGFGRFIRGEDLLGIESDVWVGCPTGSHCRLTDGVVHNESWIPHHSYFPYPPTILHNTTTTTRAPWLTTEKGMNPTSATQPSRRWPGGKEILLGRSAFSHSTVAPLVQLAVLHSLGRDDLGMQTALQAVSGVWSRSARGLRLRIEIKGIPKHVVVSRHIDGQVTLA